MDYFKIRELIKYYWWIYYNTGPDWRRQNICLCFLYLLNYMCCDLKHMKEMPLRSFRCFCPRVMGPTHHETAFGLLPGFLFYLGFVSGGRENIQSVLDINKVIAVRLTNTISPHSFSALLSHWGAVSLCYALTPTPSSLLMTDRYWTIRRSERI